MSYIIRPVSELSDSVESSAVIGNETIIKFKNKEKKGYFFSVPAVTDNFVLTLVQSDKGMSAARDWIESLIKAAGKKRFDAGQGFSSADITIAALCDIAAETSENIRLTKENIAEAFDKEWRNTIAYALILERDAESAIVLLGDDAAAKQALWDGAVGNKFLVLAGNYKGFFLRGAERKPTFEDERTKGLVLKAVSYLDTESQLVQKLADKLKDAPIASVDDIAL